MAGTVDDDENVNGPEQSIPWADEASPGLGRRSGLIESQRRTSGGLSDDSPENPVRDSNPLGKMSPARNPLR